MATSLLADCHETGQQYHEVDYIVQCASQAWSIRCGGAGTKDRELKPKNIRITVGLEKELIHGPPPPPTQWDPVPPRSAGRDVPGVGSGSPRRLPTGCRLGPPPEGPASKRGQADLTEVFQVEDFILLESPTLAEMLWARQGIPDLGTLRRSAELFPGVLLLLKLRWLVRLHSAMVHLAGAQCGLQRLLTGVLADTCGVHAYPPHPLQAFEVMVHALAGRMRQAWPLFVAFVATHDDGPARRSVESATSPRPYTVQDTVLDANPMMRVADDIFVSWLVQQDGSRVPGPLMMKELAFFGVPPPDVLTTLPGLRAWQLVRDISGSRDRCVRQAQTEAHHLALLLELPDMRPRWELGLEEMLEMTRVVLAYSRTFNRGLCTRLVWLLSGAVTVTGEVHSTIAQDLDDTQRALFRVARAGVADCGRVQPDALDKLRDTSPPRLVGRAPRFKGGDSKAAVN